MSFLRGRALCTTVITILLILALALGCLYQRERSRLQNAAFVQHVSELAWKELPPGTNSQQVLDFLAGHNIPHSEYMAFDSKDPHRDLYGAPAVVECRMRANSVFPFKTTVYFLFRFDQDGKLQSFGHRLEDRFF